MDSYGFAMHSDMGFETLDLKLCESKLLKWMFKTNAMLCQVLMVCFSCQKKKLVLFSCLNIIKSSLFEPVLSEPELPIVPTSYENRPYARGTAESRPFPTNLTRLATSSTRESACRKTGSRVSVAEPPGGHFTNNT